MIEKPHSAPVVKAKMTAPPADDNFILRHTQIAKLDLAVRSWVTLITGSAGYGKTTVAAQWKAHASLPSVWLSVDVDDNDLNRFVRYLAASLRVILPGCCPGVAELLESPQNIPAVQLVDTLDRQPRRAVVTNENER